MTDGERTPYADDALGVENGTQPEEIQEFVVRRASNPYEFDGTLVWNFNNHVVNEKALAREVDDFLYDEFVIPYQASGVWGYMVSLLPEVIQEAEILTYNQKRGEYNPYPNFIRHTDEQENEHVKRRIAERIRERTA